MRVCLLLFFALEFYMNSIKFHLFFCMILRYILPLCLIVLSSCTFPDTSVLPDKTSSGSLMATGMVLTWSISLTGATVTGSLDQEDLSGSGYAYYPIFNWLETRTIRIKHNKGVETKISFINSVATSMRVVVAFPGSAPWNLRLAQILMPDENMDGPFGIDTTVNLAQKGRYELRFRENMMSGDPWSWEAIITITLLRK